jgi:predicted Zn finger-like uncharacterized protein
MLFTRCPECETTFRVTDETLKKANGQVRCGRCASVFNAYAELHDPGAKTFEPEAQKARVVEPPASAPPPTLAPASTAVTVTPLPTHQPDVKPTEGDPTAQSIGASSVADVVAEAKLAAAEGEGEAADAAAPPDGDLSATEVDRVLASNVTTPLPQTTYAWPATAAAVEDRPTNRRLTVAAAVAALALVAQTIHHFRADIASHSTFGPWLTSTYGAFGVELTPSWDVRQYQILDWIATAEPNSRGLGSLKITARIQNRGPLRQPYPAVQLRLKDRWEAAVGSRMVTPAEYLPRDTPQGGLMSPGETTRAEIEVVDPGPDAYGFELDVCIEVEASLVTCGTDEVFL